MHSSVDDFHSYLHHEVVAAGRRYERATEQVFAMTNGPVVEPSPRLLKATQDLGETTRLYVGALRRLAHFTAHQTEPHA
jgi:hypothetical protein